MTAACRALESRAEQNKKPASLQAFLLASSGKVSAPLLQLRCEHNFSRHPIQKNPTAIGAFFPAHPVVVCRPRPPCHLSCRPAFRQRQQAFSHHLQRAAAGCQHCPALSPYLPLRVVARLGSMAARAPTKAAIPVPQHLVPRAPRERGCRGWLSVAVAVAVAVRPRGQAELGQQSPVAPAARRACCRVHAPLAGRVSACAPPLALVLAPVPVVVAHWAVHERLLAAHPVSAR